MKQSSKPAARSTRSRSGSRAGPSGARVVPRNPVARSPLLRKGGPHQKSVGALRKGARDALRKSLRKPEED